MLRAVVRVRVHVVPCLCPCLMSPLYVVGVLETDAVMISFQPRGKTAFRPTMKIKGIGTPVTLECFVMNHYDQRVSSASCSGGNMDRHRGMRAEAGADAAARSCPAAVAMSARRARGRASICPCQARRA